MKETMIMKIRYINLIKEFIKDKEEIRIPIYQRNYEWDISDCEQMWQDIEDIEDISYFFGIIICRAVNGDEKIVELIDGQQRIITFSLLLGALLNSGKYPPEYKECIKKCLYKGGLRTNRKKLVLVGENDTRYGKVIDNKFIEKTERDKHNIYKNYYYFVDKIEKSEDIDKFVNNLFKKLYIVELILNKEDDAQKVFQNLNSTGKELKLADKIRNHIFMLIPNKNDNEQEYMEKQYEYYLKYWVKIEENTLSWEDEFLEKYISHKKGEDIKKKDAFKEFMTHIKGKDIKEVFKDILKYSKYYFLCGFPDKWGDQHKEYNFIKPYVNFLIVNKQTTQITYFMGVLDLYAKGNLDEEETEQAFKFTQNYYASRQIMGYDKRGYSDLYCTLNEKIAKLQKDKNLSYIEALVYHFYYEEKVTDAKKATRTDSFKEKIKSANSWPKLFLFKIAEKYQTDLPISDKFTVEHIFPQNPTRWREKYPEDWRDKREQYLHTLGNRTVLTTSDNSKAKDKPFADKKHIYAESNITINNELADFDHWGVKEIEKRTEKFIPDVVELWGLEEFEKIADKIADERDDDERED